MGENKLKKASYRTLEDTFMKGCFFFHGDIELNQCLFSKNAIDRFDIDLAKEGSYDFWENVIHPKDFYLFERILHGKRNQISGDFRFRTKQGKYEVMQCVLQMDENDKTHFSGVLTDLSLGYSTKSVSRLKEGTGFRNVLNKLCEDNREYGVLIIGIDNFKDINEIHSYNIGDEVIRTFAQQIETIINNEVSLYQLDGDNFGILYPEATLQDMELYFKKIQHIGRNLQLGNGSNVSFTISGGIALYPHDAKNGETLYRCTQVAYNEAKSRGKDQFVLYNEEISKRTAFLAKLMESLKDSIQNDFKGFYLNFQPLVYAANGELFGCEVLLRFKHENFPTGVSPVEFIPLLEKSGLIIQVGKWIIDQSFQQKKKWNKIKPNLQMSINVAAEQFRESSFIAFVMDALAKYKLDPSTITLELTESGEIKDSEEINKVFEFFRSQRIKIALDDFGTGYDSLNCLRLLSSDVLKVDRSFLERITYNVADQKILYNIINLCKSMKIDVCIEGVETEQVRELTKELGAKLIQGYYYSKPVSAEEFEFFFHTQHANSLEKENDIDSIRSKESLVYSEVKPAQAMDMNELIDQAHGGIFQVGMDQEFTFLTCNEGYRKLLGYTAKEIEEKFSNKALGFVHPDDVAFVNDEIRRQLSIGDTLKAEFRIVRKDGTPLWIIGTGNVIHSHKRNPSLVVVIVDNDIHKREELAFEAEKQKYENILNNIPGGIKCVRFDAHFTLEYISPGFLSILGYTSEDLKTKFDNKYVNMVYEEDVIKITGDVMEQLKTSNVVTLRYRSYCKDGSLIWLETVSRLMPPGPDGVQRFYSSVVNVTDTLSVEEKHVTSNFKERFEIAAKKWGDVLFELDLNGQYISFSENFMDLFGCSSLIYKLKDFYQQIHEEDQKRIFYAVEDIQKNAKIQEVEARIKNNDGSYLWCSIMFNEPDMINDKPAILIGRLKSIEKEKLEREKLIQKTELDSLTNLLNKGSLEAKIRHLMNSNDLLYALYMIDIDDFKNINDTYGHLYGDKLLQELAKRIRANFTLDTVIGRAGGDEYIVFDSYSGDKSDLEKKAKQLLHAIQLPFVFDGIEYHANISIGISQYPKDGNNFYTLFRNADSALYRVKLQDKNNFSIY